MRPFLSVFLFLISAYVGSVPSTSVQLRGLDKTSGQLFNMSVPVNAYVRFGSILIVPRACDQSAEDEDPESKAYLEIYDDSGDGQTLVYNGWMFASSPSLSPMDHPVYDVWVRQCGMHKSKE